MLRRLKGFTGFAGFAGSILTSALLLGACTTPRAYQSALDRAFSELDSRAVRGVASDSRGLKPPFAKLRGRLEMLVFPKVSDLASKTSEAPLLGFSSPIRFGITAQRLLDCAKLRKEKSSKWAHREFFPEELPQGSLCAILELAQLSPKPSAGSIRRGDLKAARIYLDEAYRTHGIEFEIHEDARSTRTARVSWDSDEPSSSGLTLLPLDLPVLSRMDGVPSPLPIPTDPYVSAKARRLGARSCSSARRYDYRDLYGNLNTVSWCAGDAWPTTMENTRFFAILLEGSS